MHPDPLFWTPSDLFLNFLGHESCGLCGILGKIESRKEAREMRSIFEALDKGWNHSRALAKSDGGCSHRSESELAEKGHPDSIDPSVLVDEHAEGTSLSQLAQKSSC